MAWESSCKMVRKNRESRSFRDRKKKNVVSNVLFRNIMQEHGGVIIDDKIVFGRRRNDTKLSFLHGAFAFSKTNVQLPLAT